MTFKQELTESLQCRCGEEESNRRKKWRNIYRGNVRHVEVWGHRTKKEKRGICISLVFMVSLLTLRSRWTTPIWWQWSTASRICWMQWLHANTRGPWVSDKLPLTVCGCELALTLRELLAVLVGRLYSNVATDPPSSHNEGYFGKMDHLLNVQNVFLGCHGHQLMLADQEKKKHSCNFVIVYYSHNTAHSLPESQNRSGVSSWPTGGWNLTDRGGRRRSWRKVCFESVTASQ